MLLENFPHRYKIMPMRRRLNMEMPTGAKTQVIKTNFSGYKYCNRRGWLLQQQVT